jgi:cysteinyl-tRNA synthetase
MLKKMVGTQRADPTEQFEGALDDDLNISAALGFLFESIRETNRALDRNELDATSAQAWLNWWERVDGVLALSGDQTALPPEIAALAEARAQARLAKDWRKSDELRDELNARGWEARDTKDGQKMTRRGGV